MLKYIASKDIMFVKNALLKDGDLMIDWNDIGVAVIGMFGLALIIFICLHLRWV